MHQKRLYTISAFVALLPILTLYATPQLEMCAKQMLASADSLAKTYNSNIQICSVFASDLDTAGKSKSWNYSYLSIDTVHPANSQMLYFVAESAHVTFDHYGTFGPGVSTMSDYWMDSDSAMLIAQRLGGSAVRSSYPACTITAWVDQPLAPPFVAEWQVDYNCSGVIRWVRINATTGEYMHSGNFPTSVQLSEARDLPARFELYQSFPNPFNPTTTILFSLPIKSYVSLKIFDLLGREVATIVSEELSAGTYSRQLNVGRLASGVYFYRLQSDSFIDTKKLVLLR